MLPNRTFYIIGASYLFVATLILMYTFQGLTGFAVSEGKGVSMNYYISIWFALAGIFVLAFPKFTRVEKKK
jgi:hypothetical protein